ncbi:MAG: AAA family ATPase, partial [Cetobacterium sp.]
MVKKKLPVGIDDFKKIIENDYYFADKTMFIDELLNKKSEVTLLPRPRRFGKTLNMSMLNYFFNIEEKEINKELFNGLYISKTDKMKYSGEYPVIYISLKDIKVCSWIECLEEIKKLLKNLFNTKRYIRESLDESEKIDFDKIEFLNETGDFVGALKN